MNSYLTVVLMRYVLMQYMRYCEETPNAHKTPP